MEEQQDRSRDYIKQIKNNEELHAALSSQKEQFIFINVRFSGDINFYEALLNRPIAGIRFLERKTEYKKEQFLKEIDPEMIVSDIQFNKKLSFLDCQFDIPLEFKNVVFKEGVSFSHSTFDRPLEIIETNLEGTAIFGFKSKSFVLIKDSVFSHIEGRNSRLSVKESFHIERTVINSHLDFSESRFERSLSLIEVTILGSFKLRNSSVGSLHFGSFENPLIMAEINELDISETEFSGQVQLSNLNINTVLLGIETVFNESVFCVNVNFSKDAYFRNSIFHKALYLENSSVKGSFEFYGATLNSDITFSDFDHTAANILFTSAQINANLWIGSPLYKDAIEYTGKISFLGANISSSTIVRIFNVNKPKSPSGEIDFSNALVKGLLDIRNVYLNKITFDGTVVTGNIQDNNTLLRAIKDRNSARILKHEAKRINNNISALSYNKLEMKLYGNTLNFKSFSDWSILKLNGMSNNYGADWGRGVIFTIACGLICYSLFNMSMYGVGFIWERDYNFIFNDETFWAGFINYFWLPTGFYELIKENKVQGNFVGAFFFVIGKILIAYGIYQTIAAFRKYI